VTAAEDAPSRIKRTVAIWATETDVNRDALHLAAEDPLQFVGKRVVSFGVCQLIKGLMRGYFSSTPLHQFNFLISQSVKCVDELIDFCFENGDVGTTSPFRQGD